MKMAKSPTKNALGKLLVDLALLKVDTWAKRQVNKMRHSDRFPICVPLNKTNWIIGAYHLQELGEHRYNLTLDKKPVHVFYSKQGAIFYSVLSRSKNQHYAKLARQILIEDRITGKLFDEVLFYHRKISKSNAKTDTFKRHLWEVRYHEANLRFKAAKKELTKNLHSAKYIKVWSDQTTRTV
jgi:hypothetical protein